MRRHGWGGNPPSSDAEAMARILEAAVTCIDEQGPAVDIAKVALRLGVTRQTIYRYYPSRQALLGEAIDLKANAVLNRVRREMAKYETQLDRAVYGMAFAMHEMQHDRALSAVYSTDLMFPVLVTGPAQQQAMDAMRALDLVPDLEAADLPMFAKVVLSLLSWSLLDEALKSDRDATVAFYRLGLAPFYGA